MIKQILKNLVYGTEERKKRVLCAYYDTKTEETKVIYIPRFESVCFHTGYINKEIEKGIIAYDIRLLINNQDEIIAIEKSPIKEINVDYAIYLDIIFKNPEEGVIAVIRHCSQDCGTKEFIEKLAPIQTKALIAIIKEIGKEGNISLNKLTKETKISRPSFDGAIAKLREYKMAEVTSQGVKGMHIKFYDLELVNRFSSIEN